MVRVRPFQGREEAVSREETGKAPHPVVEVESEFTTLVLLDPAAGYADKMPFNFDYCFTAFKPRKITFDDDEDDAPGGSTAESTQDSQEEVFSQTGLPALDNAWEGYNACVFAYGQTSSGKTYTMMGTKTEPGIIPRLCRALFEKVESVVEGQKSSKNKKTIKIQVSFMEIYNEQVKDLLRVQDKAPKLYSSRFDDKPIGQEYQNLRVRNHPLHGPFVEGITKRDVDSWGQCVEIIRLGNSARAQASTQMNDTSSRSHAIFQLWITQTEHLGAKMKGQPITSNRTAKLNLVDLAGSERTGKTDVKGKQLQEANYINKSLMTLRKVIDTLVGNAQRGQRDMKLPPYRESLLTWILADNFGGNAKTVMIANISPFYQNASETESTLRYATTAKGVVNRVRVNEDASAKLIRELQTQIKDLQKEAKQAAESAASAARIRELEDEITLSNKAIEELRDREQDLQRMTENFKLRERELLEEQAKWKAKADKLEAESNDLRAQLEESKRKLSSKPRGDAASAHPPHASTQDDDGIPLGPTGSSNSLRGTRMSKAHFWLDDTSPSSTSLPNGAQPDTSSGDPSVPAKKRKGTVGSSKAAGAAAALPSSGAVARRKSAVDPPANPAAAAQPPSSEVKAQPAVGGNPKAGRRAKQGDLAALSGGGGDGVAGGGGGGGGGGTASSSAPLVSVTGRGLGAGASSASASSAPDAPGVAANSAPPSLRKGRKRDPDALPPVPGASGAGSVGRQGGSVVPVVGAVGSAPAPYASSGLKPAPAVQGSGPKDALDEMLSPTLSTSAAGSVGRPGAAGGSSSTITYTDVGGNKDKFDQMFQPSSSAALLRKRQVGKYDSHVVSVKTGGRKVRLEGGKGKGATAAPHTDLAPLQREARNPSAAGRPKAPAQRLSQRIGATGLPIR